VIIGLKIQANFGQRSLLAASGRMTSGFYRNGNNSLFEGMRTLLLLLLLVMYAF
jgi:hypothetical protein